MTRWRRRGHEPTGAERRAHFPHIEDVISGAGQAGQHRSNMAPILSNDLEPRVTVLTQRQDVPALRA
jgi:hypothetical protein